MKRNLGRTGSLACQSLSSVCLVDKVQVPRFGIVLYCSCSSNETTIQKVNHCYNSMKYWRNWWHLLGFNCCEVIPTPFYALHYLPMKYFHPCVTAENFQMVKKYVSPPPPHHNKNANYQFLWQFLKIAQFWEFPGPPTVVSFVKKTRNIIFYYIKI